jgi:hypothetical protein
MYHKASIAPLSSTQISKVLNGHSVRISAGNGHDIELSKEQLKKFARAQKTGKGMTLTMDPFQMQNHQHLRGSGVGRRKKFNKWVDTLGARPVIESGMSKAASTISGSGVGRRKKFNKWVDALGAKPVIEAGMSKAASTISGSGVGRRNKFNKWVDTLGARPVIESGMSKAASTISGFGLKKRKAPRRRSPSDARGGALYVAGTP